MMSHVFVYITNPSEAAAKKLASSLIDKKLIACANIFPVSSIYKWKGRTMDEKEFILIAKTSGKMFSSVKKFVEENHPYEVPCITKIIVKPNDAYVMWLDNQMRK